MTDAQMLDRVRELLELIRVANQDPNDPVDGESHALAACEGTLDLLEHELHMRVR